MNHSQLVRAVAETAGLSSDDARTAVGALVTVVSGGLAAEESVTLQGLGTFEVRHRAARTGRNPQTGEAMQIAASKAPAFKAAASLKRAVAGR